MVGWSDDDSVGGRVERVLLDTADTGSGLNTDSDVTLITPPGVPRVLDEVVFDTVEGTVTNSKDSVVEVSTAFGTSDDTRGVVLEDGSVGLNGDGNGLLVEGRLECGGGFALNGGVFGGTNSTGVGTSLARTVSASVSVVRLVSKFVGLGVFVSVVLPATVATTVTIAARAVNKLLLRERNELAGGNEVGTFETTSGGEGPAGTATTLILDGGDGTLVDPVDASGKLLLRKDFGLVGDGELKRWLVTKHSSVLSISKVRHVVVGKSPGVVGGGVLSNAGFDFHESGHSEFEFLAGTVGSAPLLDPFHEGGLVGSNSSDKHSGEGLHLKVLFLVNYYNSKPTGSFYNS